MTARVLVGVFDREEDILRATTAARQEGVEIVDVFTPYAVHGMDRAIGLKGSRLSWVCFIFGLLGALTAAWFQYWASATDWPLNIGGKPWQSWAAFTPIVFETMVLSGGVATVLFFFAWAGLWPGRRSPVSDLRVTDDRFALMLRPSGSGDDGLAVEALLARFHPVRVEERQVVVGRNGARP